MSLFEIYQPYANNFNPLSMDDVPTEYAYSLPIFPDISSSIQYLETMLSDECMEFPGHVNDFQVNSVIDDISLLRDDFEMGFDEFDSIFNTEENYISQQSSSDGTYGCNPDHAVGETSMESSLVLPFQGMEVDKQLCLTHLLEAYAEAIDNQETSLSRVIGQHINQKVINPVNSRTFERLLHHMFQHLKSQTDYLTQESFKNFYPAFKVFYQMFPYGKFAHSVENSAILEAMPRHAEIIYLIDFDIGEGIQWAAFMDAIKHQNKQLRIISVKSIQEDETSPWIWPFEETERRLYEHAELHRQKVEIEEMELHELESLMNNIRKGYYGKKSWYVCNCNVRLPHMGREKSHNNVLHFLKLAKNFLQNNKGIITYGHGEAWDSATSCTSFSSFLEGNFKHYQALLESIDFSFPRHLGEARTVLECLFVAPYVSSMVWERRWEEKMKSREAELRVGLEGWRLSGASLSEAKELVEESSGSPYEVNIEGKEKNEMVLRWQGIPMVRVCCWAKIN